MGVSMTPKVMNHMAFLKSNALTLGEISLKLVVSRFAVVFKVRSQPLN